MAPTQSPQSTPYTVAIVLDITGSMTAELAAVKAAAVELVKELEAKGIAVHIRLITFTESGMGCFVVDRLFKSYADAVSAIDNVRLSRAPDGSEAGGDDGPENVKAAVLQLLEDKAPTIAFLITDDLPHLRSHFSSNTAVHEAKWLSCKGLDAHVAGDAVRLFRHVVDRFGGDLVLNCVLFDLAAVPMGIDVYGQLAAATGGLVMKPKSGQRSSDALAAGLLHIVLKVLDGDGADPASRALDAYDMYDVSGLPVRDAEPAEPVRAPLGDTAELFATACLRMVKLTGGKWTKRAKGIVAGREQLRVVCDACLYVSTFASKDAPARAAARAALADRIAAVAAAFRARGAEGPCHFRLTIEDVDAKAAAFADACDEGAAGTSMVSLEDVRGLLESLGSLGDEDDDDLLARFMSLLSGFSARVDLPLDRDGKPDFMSAWAAAIPAVAADRITAAEFMRLVGGADGHRGLTDAARYNAFLAAPEPGDRCATLAFGFASATQVLNWATAVAMGAGAAGYVPNLAPGLLASALVRACVCTSASGGTEFARKQAATLANALASLLRPVGGESPNPEDEVGKLLAALLSRGCRDAAAWRGALEEWLAAIVQRYHRTAPAADADRELALVLSGSVDGADRDVDPETELHALEGAPELSLTWAPAAAVSSHPAVASFARAAPFLLAALPLPLVLEDVWPGWSGSPALHLLLLRDRTERYSYALDASDASKAATWTRRDASDVKGAAELVFAAHRASKAAELRSIRARREAVVRERLVEAAAAALARPAPFDEACAALKLSATVMTSSDVLRRSDAHAVLARVAAAAQGSPEDLARASLALVLGPWTTEPASGLKKAKEAFLDAAASADPADLERMKAAFGVCSCLRKTGTNRHGHSDALQYPGALGYTAEYAAHRRAHLASASAMLSKRSSASLSRRLEANLASMERCSAFAAWANSVDLDAKTRDEVSAALAKHSDANKLALDLPSIEARIVRMSVRST